MNTETVELKNSAKEKAYEEIRGILHTVDRSNSFVKGLFKHIAENTILDTIINIRKDTLTTEDISKLRTLSSWLKSSDTDIPKSSNTGNYLSRLNTAISNYLSAIHGITKKGEYLLFDLNLASSYYSGTNPFRHGCFFEYPRSSGEFYYCGYMTVAPSTGYDEYHFIRVSSDGVVDMDSEELIVREGDSTISSMRSGSLVVSEGTVPNILLDGNIRNYVTAKRNLFNQKQTPETASNQPPVAGRTAVNTRIGGIHSLSILNSNGFIEASACRLEQTATLVATYTVANSYELDGFYPSSFTQNSVVRTNSITGRLESYSLIDFASFLGATYCIYSSIGNACRLAIRLEEVSTMTGLPIRPANRRMVAL